jgi:hypothetical protein
MFFILFYRFYLGILDFRKAPLPPKFFLFGKIEKAIPGTYIHRCYLVHIEFQGKPPTKQTKCSILLLPKSIAYITAMLIK